MSRVSWGFPTMVCHPAESAVLTPAALPGRLWWGRCRSPASLTPRSPFLAGQIGKPRPPLSPYACADSWADPTLGADGEPNARRMQNVLLGQPALGSGEHWQRPRSIAAWMGVCRHPHLRHLLRAIGDNGNREERVRKWNSSDFDRGGGIE